MSGLAAIPAFRRWIVMRAAATLAGQIQLAAISWAVYAATGDPLDLAWVGLAQFLPVLLLSLPAGTLVDRVDRRSVLMVAILGQGALSALAAALVATDRLHGAAVWAIGLGMGTVRAFSAPASQALVPALVPTAMLGRALAASATVFQVSTIVGPSLAGLAIAAGGGADRALLVAAGLQALGAFAAGRLPPVQPPPGAIGWDALLGGLRYVRDTPILFACLSLDLFAVLLGGATALLPIYAQDVLQVGAQGYGVLRSAPAVGATAMAVLLARWPIQRRAGPRLFAAVAVFGLATMAFGLSRSFPLSVACLAVVGAADMVSVVVRQTLVQLRTPDHVRGRVSAVNFVFIGASNELGEFESGVAARWLGPVPAVVLGGLGTLAVVAVWAWRFPDLRRADRLDDG